MRTTFAGTRLQALSIIFVRSFSACVVGRKRIRRPPAIRLRPYRRDRGGQPGPGFLRKGQCYGSFPTRCAKGFGGTSTRLASALPLLPASALLMASLDIARQQLVTGGSKAISESLSAAAHLRSGVTTEGGSVTHPLALALGGRIAGIMIVTSRPGGLSCHEARAQLFTDHRVHLEMSTDGVRHRGGHRCRNLARRRAVPRCAACTARHRTSESGPVALPSPGPRAMSIRGCLLLRYGGGARQGCDRPRIGRHPQRLSAGDPEPDGRRGRHPRGDRIPAGNDPCAIRHVLRWRAPRRVSHPCHDLSRAIDAMTPADSCRLPGRDVP